MKRKTGIIFVFGTMFLFAQEEPTPLDVANTVSNLWFNNKLAELSTYATNLYSGTRTNYLPAILVSAFHDGAFLGKLWSETNKLSRVKIYVENNSQVFTNLFIGELDTMIQLAKDELDMHVTAGHSSELLETNASPQSVRNIAGNTMLPDILILYYAPNITLP